MKTNPGFSLILNGHTLDGYRVQPDDLVQCEDGVVGRWAWYRDATDGRAIYFVQGGPLSPETRRLRTASRRLRIFVVLALVAAVAICTLPLWSPFL